MSLDKETVEKIPAWFTVFNQGLQDNLKQTRELIEDKFDEQNAQFSAWLSRQDVKLGEIHSAQKETNGRVTALERREAEDRATEQAFEKYQAKESSRVEKNTEYKRWHTQSVLMVTCAVMGAVVSGVGHVVGIW